MSDMVTNINIEPEMLISKDEGNGLTTGDDRKLYASTTIKFGDCGDFGGSFLKDNSIGVTTDTLEIIAKYNDTYFPLNYVKKTGDTMTGSLEIDMDDGGGITSPALRVKSKLGQGGEIMFGSGTATAIIRETGSGNLLLRGGDATRSALTVAEDGIYANNIYVGGLHLDTLYIRRWAHATRSLVLHNGDSIFAPPTTGTWYLASVNNTFQWVSE
jgi:hypothetical protein